MDDRNLLLGIPGLRESNVLDSPARYQHRLQLSSAAGIPGGKSMG